MNKRFPQTHRSGMISWHRVKLERRNTKTASPSLSSLSRVHLHPSGCLLRCLNPASMAASLMRKSPMNKQTIYLDLTGFADNLERHYRRLSDMCYLIPGLADYNCSQVLSSTQPAVTKCHTCKNNSNRWTKRGKEMMKTKESNTRTKRGNSWNWLTEPKNLFNPLNPNPRLPTSEKQIATINITAARLINHD